MSWSDGFAIEGKPDQDSKDEMVKQVN